MSLAWPPGPDSWQMVLKIWQKLFGVTTTRAFLAHSQAWLPRLASRGAMWVSFGQWMWAEVTRTISWFPSVYWFPRAVVTPDREWLAKAAEINFLTVLEVRNLRSKPWRTASFWRLVGESVPCFLSRCGGSRDPWRSLACRWVTPISISLFMWLSPVSLCLQSFLL